MNADEAKRRHTDIFLAGFRSHLTATGLLQLVRELRATGTLDQAAVDRIKEAVVSEAMVNRPPGMAEDEVRKSMQARLDRLLHGGSQ